jgi:hypothetical protein
LTPAYAGDAPATRPASEFAKGSQSVHSVIAYEVGLGSTRIPSVQLGYNYYLADRFSVGVEATLLGVSQPGDDAVAVAALGTFRHHFFERDRYSLFWDFGFGPFEASDRVPEGGTQFNFITRTGPGLTCEVAEGTLLMVAARYWHLSNAQIEGADRNPSLNAAELSVGLMWRW